MQTFPFFENTGGMNLRPNDLSMSSGEAEEIVNLHATTYGSWSSSNVGYLNLNTTALASGASVTGLYEYITLSGTSHLVSTAGHYLYSFEPILGNATVLSSDFNTSLRTNFCTFNGLLIACNGITPPKKWDGTNAVSNLGGWTPSIPGLSPGMPSISEIFANRLVFSGDANNPSLVYISEQENPENFTPGVGSTSAGAIQISPGDGQKVTGLKTLFLPVSNEEVLVIFKDRSTYLLSGNDSDSFSLQKLSDEFGAVSHLSIMLVGNELMFLSKEGITSLSTATAQGNLTTGFLSDRIRSQIMTLNTSKLAESFGIHLRNRQEVWWFVADGSESQNQTVLVYNYGINRAWSKRTGITASCGVTMNGLLYTGNYQGIIQQQLKGNSYNGQPIPWTYRTGFQDLNDPRLRKRIKDIELFLKQISNVNVTVNMYWDFRRGSTHRQSRVLNVLPDTASSTYGTAQYGADFYHVIGSSVFKFIPSGSGRHFQLEFTGQELNRPVEIEGWLITAIYGGYH